MSWADTILAETTRLKFVLRKKITDGLESLKLRLSHRSTQKEVRDEVRVQSNFMEAKSRNMNIDALMHYCLFELF